MGWFDFIFTGKPEKTQLQSEPDANSWSKQQSSQMPTVQGHWVSDLKTGMRFVTDPITADESKILQRFTVSGLDISGLVLGPFPKAFVRTSFGQNIFYAPETISYPGEPLPVPILCQCRNIDKYIRDQTGKSSSNRFLGADYAILFAKTPPACWEDSSNFQNFTGGTQFTVTVRHPAFYQWMASSNASIGLATNALDIGSHFTLGGFKGSTLMEGYAAYKLLPKILGSVQKQEAVQKQEVAQQKGGLRQPLRQKKRTQKHKRRKNKKTRKN